MANSVKSVRPSQEKQRHLPESSRTANVSFVFLQNQFTQVLTLAAAFLQEAKPLYF